MKNDSSVIPSHFLLYKHISILCIPSGNMKREEGRDQALDLLYDNITLAPNF